MRLRWGPDMAAGVAVIALASAAPALAAPSLPFCPGFAVVTAVSQGGVDYESIKTVESVSDQAVRFRYSAEKMEFDMFSAEPPGLKKTLTFRTVRNADFETANLFLQHFGEQLPELVPETVAVSMARAVRDQLKATGSAELGVFIPFNVDKPGIDRDQHPNVYDNQMIATATLTGGPAPFKVTLNGEAVELPALHVEADFYGDRSEFFVLDDPVNPIVLKFRIGIDAIQPLTPEEIEQRKLLDMPTQISPDKETLQVVKIISPCVETPVPEPQGGGGEAPADAVAGLPAPVGGSAAPAGGAAEAIAEAIEAEGRIDIQSIFFTVDSAEIRTESDAALAAIGQVLADHPDWRLSVEGHTDSQGEAAHNLDLSVRRAQSVRQALIDRYAVAADRLETQGHGESRPVADNATLEGRARNRRVELVRL